ncbi:MAG: DUF4345 family protein [Solirubrobacterales bacterium]|nr:DUF4345 family protein [Solirubrobacterales bacterium]
MVAGAYAALTGVAGMPGATPVDASVDSELRYFATFYIAYGLVALWIVPRVEVAAWPLRA